MCFTKIDEEPASLGYIKIDEEPICSAFLVNKQQSQFPPLHLHQC